MPIKILTILFLFISHALVAQDDIIVVPIDSSFYSCGLELDCLTPSAMDYNYFCKAAHEADTSKGLSFYTLGDPGHISACQYYAYEYWGVRLVPLGILSWKGWKQK